MIKHLQSVGDGLGIVIERAILDLLGIDEQTPLEVRTDGEGLIIRPAGSAGATRPPASAPPANAPPPPPPAPPSAADDLLGDIGDDELGDIAGDIDLDDVDLEGGLDSPVDDDDLGLGDLDDDPPAAAPPPPPPEAAAPPPPPKAPEPPAAPPPPPPAEAKSEPKPERQHSTSMAEVVIFKNREEVMRTPLQGPRMVIGREASADIHLDDRALSRKHAAIEKRGAALWVSDMKSANGTYINGQKILEPERLHAGDVIGVGHYKIKLEGLAVANEETPVLTLDGPEGVHRFAMVGEQIVIGRAQSCDISVGHKSISRRHMMVTVEGNGFVVEDLGSQNGVTINGRRITEPTPVSAGELLKICEFTIELGFLEEDSPAEGDGRPAHRRGRTMLIDRKSLARAAYVEGDFEKVKSSAAVMAGRQDAGTGGKGNVDTGEYDLDGKKPKIVKGKKRARR